MISKILKENQLEIIKEQNTKINKVCISISFHGGPLYEDKSMIGITNILKRMLFRNLNGLSQSEIYKKTEKIGGKLVGNVYKNFLQFRITVSPKYFLKAFDVIKEFFGESMWNEKDLEKEKKYVLNELEKKKEDFEGSLLKYYGNKSILSMDTIGSVDSVKSIELDDLKKLKESVIKPKNCTVIIAGHFFNTEYEKVEQMLKNLPNSHSGKALKANKIIIRNFENRGNCNYLIKKEYNYCNVGFIFDVNTSKYSIYDIKLINKFLGKGYASRLSEKVREELGLTDEIYTKFYFNKDFGRFMIISSFEPSYLIEGIKAIAGELKGLRTNINEDDINSALVYLTDNRKWLLDDPESLCNDFLFDKYNDEQVVSVDESIEKYDQVGVGYLKYAVKKIFTSSNLSLVATYNESLVKIKELNEAVDEIRSMLM